MEITRDIVRLVAYNRGYDVRNTSYYQWRNLMEFEISMVILIDFQPLDENYRIYVVSV